ncbi:MAG: hypothetical protein EZS28_026698 [Streblomastix strix]|uniref:Uncharacterized protein n=1 Tax=Streblomastix strix TaxID=222440 RepID=A0A5J4V5W7_9EUKA|nr:MAG: hypothetical protein EZS28_026698 [Streblomastix strix]
MPRKTEKRREQDNTNAIAESNQFQQQRGISATIGLIDKGRVESGNNQSDQLTGNSTMEQNICNQETGRRIENNNGLSTTEHTTEIPTFYNERLEQSIGNMEEERLGMFDGYQISIQPCNSNRGVGEIPSVYARGNTLYEGGNAFLNLNSTEDFRKDYTNNNRQSEKQESSPDSELCR